MKQLFAIFIISVFLLSAKQSFAQSSYRDFYNNAVKAYDAKDYASYLENMEKVAELLPLRPQIMWNLAGAYALNQRKADAFAVLEKLVWLMPNTKMLEDKDFDNLVGEGKLKKIVAKMEAMAKPINQTQEGFTIPDINFHPEGLAYDSQKDDFYCSSIRLRKIVKVSASGEVIDFISSKQDGVWAVSGMKIDAEKRELWVTSAVTEQMADYDTSMILQTGVFCFDLASGKLKAKYIMPDDGKPHYFGDLAIHPVTRDIYITDSYQPNIYRLVAQSEEIKLFTSGKQWSSLQGLAFSDNGNYLLVSNYRTNVFRVEVSSGISIPLIAPKNILLAGIDGLYLQGNQLTAIHNGIQPFRIVRYQLDKDLRKVKKYKILASRLEVLNEPTLGVQTPKGFYFIANSPWGAYSREGKFIVDRVGEGKVLKVK